MYGTPRGAESVTDGTDTHIPASAGHSDPLIMHAGAPIECDNNVPGDPVASVDVGAPRPAHTCTVGGVVAICVSD